MLNVPMLGNVLGPRLEGVHKIAALRANAIGDFLCTVPALEALRAAYPRAELTLLGQPWHAGFLSGRPGPWNRVIPVPQSEGVYVPRGGVQEDQAELDAFFSRMQAEQFDLAVQLHGGGRFSNPFVRRLGARFTVGLRAPDAPDLDRTLPYVFSQHEVVRGLEVVSLVGAQPVTLTPRVAVTAADLAESRAVLRGDGVPGDDGPLVALHPGAGDPRRRWSPARFAAVGDDLASRGARVVVTGAPEEAEVVSEVVAHMRRPALNLCGQLSLGGLAGLLSRRALLISNDSGPMHLGAAVGARTVGIYWCLNFANWNTLTRARHRPLVSWQINCPVCGVDCVKGKCAHTASLVDAVTVGEVLGAALDLLDLKPTP